MACRVADTALAPLVLVVPMMLLPEWDSPWVLAAAALAGCAHLAAGGRLRVWTPADWPMALLALSLVPAFWAWRQTQASPDALLVLAAGIWLCSAVTTWASTPRRLAATAGFLLVTVCGIAMLAPLVSHNWTGMTMNAALHWLSELKRSVSLGGGDFNQNILGAAIAMAWPLAACLFLSPWPKKRPRVWLGRLALGLALVFMAIVLWLTTSGGAQVALVVALLCISGVRWARLRALWLAAVCGLLLLVKARPSSLVGVLGAIVGSMGWDSRVEIWSQAWCMIKDMPFTGIGPGAFDNVQPRLYPFSAPWGQVHHAHNLYLQVALDVGLVGLVAYLALLLGAFGAALGAYRRYRAQERGLLAAATLGVFGSLVVMSLHGLVDAAAWSNKAGLLSWFVIGLAYALHRYAMEVEWRGHAALCAKGPATPCCAHQKP
ncbi:MAG: O-antigen ligase family protein [Anaerolineae bacterium]